MSQRWIALAFFISCTASAAAGSGQQAIELLQSLKVSFPAINLEAYQREMKYQQQEMAPDQRARIEASRLSAEITSQVHKMYHSALERTGNAELAAEEITSAIEQDLVLIADDMQDDIRELSLNALEAARRGGSISAEANLPKLEKLMLRATIERSLFLNNEMFSSVHAYTNNTPVTEKDSEKLEYKSMREIMNSLVSQKASTRWTDSAGMDIDSGVARRTDGQISFQFKTKFLGIALEAGPVITIKKEISSSARIVTEGHHPLLTSNGNFDFAKRDQNSKAIIKNGSVQKRFSAFFCEASLIFKTDYVGSGGFSYMGIGGSVGRGREVSDRVNVESRRILLPEYIDGKSVTMPLLRQLCHVDFLRARINNTMTMKQSMEVTMKNMLAGAIFIHPKTKCVVDNHCLGWFKKEKINLVGKTAYPRCAEESREKYRACVVTSLAGQRCPVMAKGKLVSSGANEYNCDRGLKCVVTKKPGPLFFQHAVAQCVPQNKNYKAPPSIK